MPRLAALLVLLCACARPLPTESGWTLREMNTRYHAFYSSQGDPDATHDAGVLRPRFGLPAITQTGAPFSLELLERGGTHQVRAALIEPGVLDAEAMTCLSAAGAGDGSSPGPGCYALDLQGPSREPLGDGTEVARFQARPLTAPPPGGYDLFVVSPVDAPARIPRAVWLRADDPQALSQVRVAHLSDLHVGKGNEALYTARIRSVLRDVNALSPDLVVVTGDLVNRGQDPGLAPRAQALLLSLQAPVLVVMGNHDIEHRARSALGRYGLGWPNFARSFHPFLHFTVNVGGYDFVGFDSGPAAGTPRILTRGLSPATIDELRTEVDASQAAGHRGVVLFSHAPSRASVFARVRPSYRGFFGRMGAGSAAFEQVMLDAAARGQRVIHLAGHTHWSDVFEARQRAGKLRFLGLPKAGLSPCTQAITGRAAIITTQAASHSGVFFKKNARGYGFSFLRLGDGDPELAFHRYGVAQRVTCPTS